MSSKTFQHDWNTVLPFKDQIAADAVHRQLRDLSNKIAITLQPTFVSKKLQQDLKPKLSQVLQVSIVLFINLYVICVMQIMLAIQPDTLIDALLNTSLRLSVNTFSKCMVTKILMRAKFVLSRSAIGHLTASFTKCYSSKNRGLVLKCT